MHYITLAYEAERDFPMRSEEPSLRYMIAASPRTGSTFLALQLWRTGVFGAPMEYLNIKHSKGMIQRLGSGDYKSYWENLKRMRTSNNGVFGLKMFTGDYKFVARECPELIEEMWTDKVLFLTRKDKIGQAVSHFRAQHSGAWFSGTMVQRDVDYDFSKIKRFYDIACENENSWESIFELTGTSPCRIFYEDMIDNVSGTMELIRSYMGIDDKESVLDHITINEVQRDEVNALWHERFRNDLRNI